MNSYVELVVRANQAREATDRLCVSAGKTGSLMKFSQSLEAYMVLLKSHFVGTCVVEELGALLREALQCAWKGVLVHSPSHAVTNSILYIIPDEKTSFSVMKKILTSLWAATIQYDSIHETWVDVSYVWYSLFLRLLISNIRALGRGIISSQFHGNKTAFWKK